MRMIKIVLVVLLVTMTIAMQIYASKRKSAKTGLILPALLFCITCIFLGHEVHEIHVRKTEMITFLTPLTYFAVYNVPTILFLCIYNYCQRSR